MKSSDPCCSTLTVSVCLSQALLGLTQLSFHLLPLINSIIIIIIIVIIITIIIIVIIMMGCTQIPISTLSHIWVFVRLYGIVFVIIVIIIIIIMIIKSEGVNAQL